MLSRSRQSLQRVMLARALFSTGIDPASLKSWTITQNLAAGAANTTETINIHPDGKITTTSNEKNNTFHLNSHITPPTQQHKSLITQQLQTTFLPAGYPHTVSPNYLKYVTWQAIHHTAGAANGVLASTFLLYSVGLGAGVIPTAGALSWILKDGLGQLGTLIFGRAIAHNFDLSSRTWYVAASGKLNIAMGLEIATALAPHWFLPLGATANAVKGLAWMAGGSSRSAFNVAFASDRNIADVTAKATSQTICTSLIGTAAGMAIAASIEQSVGLAFACYSALAAVHMYSAVESARSVPLATLNPSRLKKLAEIAILKQLQISKTENSITNDSSSGGDDKTITSTGSSTSNTPISIEKEERSGFLRESSSDGLPSPAELAREDSIFPPLLETIKTVTISNDNSRKRAPRLVEIVVGTSLQNLANSTEPSATSAVLAALLPLYKNKKYILVLDRVGKMHLVLHEEAKTIDAVTAVLQATIWNRLRQQQQEISSEQQSSSSTVSNNNFIKNMYHEAHEAVTVAESLAPRMVDALKIAGWDVQGVVIEPRRQRAIW